MKTLRAKLNSRAGESLAEVLIALLVSALALVMLASMISHSFKLITASRDKLDLYYGDASMASPESAGNTASVVVSLDGASLSGYAVQYADNNTLGRPVVSYAPGASGAGGGD